MNLFYFKYRTEEEEVMDDFYLQGPELRKTLQDLSRINRWLGGNGISIEGIDKILNASSLNHPIKIIDVGCGDGMMLREIAQYGRKRKLKLELLGLDANGYAVEIAKELSAGFPEISYVAMNVFSEEFEKLKADIFLCTLTLHHFREEQIQGLIKLFLKNCKLGIVINDLQRSRVAYQLFQAFCTVFINNRIARKDGLISIRRGFRKKELEIMGSGFQAKQEIKWKWAYRYQWIFYKKEIAQVWQ